MKKILLPLLVSVLALSLSAQTQSGYVPFHQYLLSSHGDIQKHDGNARNVVFEEIAYMHYIPVPNDTTWTYSDSGQFYFNQYNQGVSPVFETGGTYFKFVNDIKWDTSAQLTATVDSQLGLPLTVTGQNYNESNATFTNSYQYSYTYNTSVPVNYLNSYALATWNGSGWNDSVGYAYTYASTVNNYDSTVIAQSGNPLQPDTQYLYTYTGWSNSELLTQTWGGSAWVNLLKQTNSFDANNNNYQSFISMWNGSAWVPYGLITRGFDLNNEQVSYISQLYNSGTGAYVNDYQEAYAYLLGNITQFENYNWNDSLNAWVPNVLYNYTSDSYHNVIYEYDETYTNGAFDEVSQYYYYYNTSTVSSIRDIPNDLSISINPNPSSGNAMVNFTSDNATGIWLNIYDENGNMLKQQKYSTSVGGNQFPVNISAYAAGNYFVQVVDDNSGKSGILKFVKQ